MTSWWHSAYGKFDTEQGWIGLDYGKLADRQQADLTLCHETVHSVLTMTTEYGQTSTAIFQQSSLFQHISKDEIEKIKRQIYASQWDVQEGSATLMEILILRQKTDKAYALKWLNEHFPANYIKAFNILKPGFELSFGYRELFTAKIPHLAMETNLRRDAVKDHLLENSEKLNKYFDIVDNNPNLRLIKLSKAVSIKPWIVTKSEREIAKEAGIEYFGSTPKIEVANFLNYLLDLSNIKPFFSEKDIGNAPSGSEAYDKAFENMIVANMNLDLANTAEMLSKKVDFLNYSDVMEIVFISKATTDKNRSEGERILESIAGEPFEYGVLGITKTGEKYVCYMSTQSVIDALKGPLSQATILTKWGAYSLYSDSFVWWQDIKPTVVAYNTVSDLDEKLNEQIIKNPSDKFEKIHLQFMDNHPLQTLLLKKVGSGTWNILNTFGDKSLLKLLEKYKDNVVQASIETVKGDARHLNNAFELWLNLPKGIDWVEMMTKSVDASNDEIKLASREQ